MKPPLASLAGLYFRIGNSTFGSGNTAIILIGREMIRRGWLKDSQFDLIYTVARIVPGTNVLAFVASSAHLVRGWSGAFVALAALSLPASGVVILLTLAFQRWHNHPVGGAVIAAAMASIVGIIVGAAWLMAYPRFRAGERLKTILFVTAGLVLSFWLSPLTVLALAAVAGCFWPQSFLPPADSKEDP